MERKKESRSNTGALTTEYSTVQYSTETEQDMIG